MGTMGLVEGKVNGANGASVAHTIARVIEWAEGQSKKGDMESVGAPRVTALRQMAEQIAHDEPDDARFLLENIDRSCAMGRPARHRGGKPDTVRTYASKAKTTIVEDSSVGRCAREI